MKTFYESGSHEKCVQFVWKCGSPKLNCLSYHARYWNILENTWNNRHLRGIPWYTQFPYTAIWKDRSTEINSRSLGFLSSSEVVRKRWPKATDESTSHLYKRLIWHAAEAEFSSNGLEMPIPLPFQLPKPPRVCQVTKSGQARCTSKGLPHVILGAASVDTRAKSATV